MGKLNLKRYLIVLPLTASILVNTKVYTEDKNQTINNNKQDSTQVYELAPKYKELSSPQLAVKVQDVSNVLVKTNQELPKTKLSLDDKLLKPSAERIVKAASFDKNKKDNEKVAEENKQTVSESKLEEMKEMVDGYPISEMLPYISKRKPETAAFLVAIAKKESNWGKRSPHSGGKDCYNYWGFKDRRFITVLGGHSCFPSAETAIETVGNRIDKLIESGLNTPSEIVVWKCGRACSGDAGAKKWISDVGSYYNHLAYAPSGK